MTRPSLRGVRTAVFFVVAWAMGQAGLPLLGQVPQPRLRAIYPLGVSAGGEIELKLFGDDVKGAGGLMFSHPGLAAQRIQRPADRFYPQRLDPDRFRVRADAGVPPGIYEVRVVGRYGVSNARLLTVSDRVEGLEKEPNNQVSEAQELAVGAAVSGVCDERGFDYFRFAARKGQRLILHAQAQSHNSLADATLVLTDANAKELASSRDFIGRDPMIDFTVPADGTYFLKVYDFLYRGGDRYPYRLVIHAGPWLDFIDPPIVQAGVATTHTVYGRNLPGGTGSGLSLAGRALEKLEVRIDAPGDPLKKQLPASDLLSRPTSASADFLSYRLTGPGGRSNPLRLTFAEGAVVREAEPNDQPGQAQKITVPCEMLSRFDGAGGRDYFVFDAAKGQAFAIEVLAERVGLPCDPLLVVQQLAADGKARDLKELDDTRRRREDNKASLGWRYGADSSDPSWHFVAPENGTYRLLVRDLFASGEGDLRHRYRLRIREPEPDFRLVAFVHRPPGIKHDKNYEVSPLGAVIRPGGALPIVVAALRRPGFDGEIELTAESMPPGVSAKATVIPPWDSHGAIVLRAAADAKGGASAIRIQGRQRAATGPYVTRPARFAETVFYGGQKQLTYSRLVGQLIVGVDDHLKSPAEITFGGEQTYRMARGGKLEIPVKLVKHGEFKGDITLKAAGLHRELQAKDVKISAGKAEQKLVMTVGQRAPAGTFSVFLEGAAKVSHRQDPEAAKAAEDDRKRIEGIRDTSKLAYETARKASQQAEQRINTARQKQQQAERAKQDAARRMGEARRRADEAKRKSASMAARAAEAKKNSDELAAKIAAAADEKAQAALRPEADRARAEADRARVATESAQRDATQQATAADAAAKKSSDAEQQLQAASRGMAEAQSGRTTAAESEQKAKGEQDEAERVLKEATDRSKQLAERAKAKDILVPVPSTCATIEIVESPVELGLNLERVELRPEAKIEIEARIRRDFGFAEAVDLSLQLPNGVRGLRLEKSVKIEKGQDAAKMVLVADASAQAGTYAATVRAQLRFGSAQLAVSELVTIVVSAPVAPPKAKD